MMGSNSNLQKHTSYLYSGFCFPSYICLVSSPLLFYSTPSPRMNPFTISQVFSVSTVPNTINSTEPMSSL